MRTLERAGSWAQNTPADDTRIALFEGLCHASLGREARAIRAFKRALALDASATLPVEVPPKIENMFAKAKGELKPLPVRPAPPPEPAVAEPPPPPPAPPPEPELKTIVAAAEPPAKPTEVVGDASLPDARPNERRFKLQLGVDAIGDVLGKSIGVAPSIAFDFWMFEVRLRGLIGSTWGLSLDAAWVILPDSRVSPRIGGRLTTFPSASGFGGGPQAGVRIVLGAGFSLNAEAAVEFYAINEAFSPIAVVLGGGIAWNPLGL